MLCCSVGPDWKEYNTASAGAVWVRAAPDSVCLAPWLPLVVAELPVPGSRVGHSMAPPAFSAPGARAQQAERQW